MAKKKEKKDEVPEQLKNLDKILEEVRKENGDIKYLPYEFLKEIEILANKPIIIKWAYSITEHSPNDSHLPILYYGEESAYKLHNILPDGVSSIWKELKKDEVPEDAIVLWRTGNKDGLDYSNPHQLYYICENGDIWTLNISLIAERSTFLHKGNEESQFIKMRFALGEPFPQRGAHNRCKIKYSKNIMRKISKIADYALEQEPEWSFYKNITVYVTSPKTVLDNLHPYAGRWVSEQKNAKEADVILDEERKFIFDEDGLAILTLLAPGIEVLEKADYAFARSLVEDFVMIKNIKCIYYSQNLCYPFLTADYLLNNFQKLQRLCNFKGKNPKEIFKAEKAVYQTLKGETNLSVWDSFRKMSKFGKIPKVAIETAYNLGMSAKQLEKCRHILGYTYNEKPVFSWSSLQKYLARIDRYEAIDLTEGLQLLDDYLASCKILDIKPKVDGDSLKREHDVAARMVREARDELTKTRFDKTCSKHSKFNYEDEHFLIRAFTDYADLIDEARQQHNCVASYANAISSNKANVFVLRRKCAPEKSFVTVEATKDFSEITQSYLAYNQPVRNANVTEFLGKWTAYASKKKKESVLA